MRITESARKHGITDADMIHAIRYAVSYISQPSNIRVYFGADTTGRILEVGVADWDLDEARVIHAMPIRPKFYVFL
jgi:hypothetical protein